MEQKFNFNVIINSFIYVIPINFVVLLFLTIYRFIFFLYFADLSTLSGLSFYILKAFWMGFRFDLSIVAYINAPITLLFLICLILKNSFVFKIIIYFIKYYYLIIFSLLFFVLFIDFGFFSYFKDHYNILIFGVFEDDTLALLKTILYDYRFYVLILIYIILVAVMYNLSLWTYKELKFNEKIFNTLYWKNNKKFIVIIIILVLNFICARGSFSMFPLGLFYSQISPNQFINKLCVNPVHPLADTIYLKIKNSRNTTSLRDIFKCKDEKAILKDLSVLSKYKNATTNNDILNKITKENKKLEKIKPNVVLIVMEGLGEVPIISNNKNFNVMGELKEHFDEDIVFYNFLPAGFITIHAIESISLSIPQRPYVNQITQTQDAFKQFSTSIILPYKNAGYHTLALYGGSMTWRDLEGFFKAQGFDDIVGEGNVVVEAKDRHSWGINDDKFFELIEKQLSDKTINAPKFIYAISTQNHPPYKVSKDYKALSLKIPSNIQNMMSTKDLENKDLFDTFQFSNRELAKFISSIKKSQFAQNTIIAVTGDHNLRELSNYNVEDLFLRYAVSFYIYIPDQIKKNINLQKIDKQVCGSHMDIMATLYNLSLSSATYNSLGNNLFDTKDNIAFNIDGLVVKDDIAIKYNFVNGSFESFLFDNKTKKLSLTKQTEKHKRLFDYYRAIMTLTDIFVKSK